MLRARSADMPIKLDASAMIYFTEVTLLDLVKTLYGEVFITEAVYQETVVQGKAAGHRDAAEVERMIGEAKIQVVSVDESAEARLRDAALPDSLGSGEVEGLLKGHITWRVGIVHRYCTAGGER